MLPGFTAAHPITVHSPAPQISLSMHRPLALRIVAAFFIVAGVAALINIGGGLLRSEYHLDFNVAGLWIGPGLLRSSRTARQWARAFLWFDLIVVVIGTGLLLALPSDSEVLLLDRRLLLLSPPTTMLVLVALVALTGWQLRVLARADIARTFTQRVS